jgi:transposase
MGGDKEVIVPTQFKPYEQRQPLLLPPSLDDLIEPNDLVRVVDQVIEQLEAGIVEAAFPGGGCPPYHPRMMLKVLVYAYCCRIYSSRKIARALRRDVAFLWLSGMQRPDFNTVNRFRSEYLKEVLPRVFARTVELLLASGHIRFEDYFLDGTKLEADASRHKVVWRKSTERYQERVQQRAQAILQEVEAINRAEDQAYGSHDLPERGETARLDSAQLQAAAEQIEAGLRQQPAEARQPLHRSARQLQELAQKQARYEQQQQLLGGRNSYSVTDPEATVMPMKDGVLKPGYNVQAAAENGFVVGYSVSQTSHDGVSLIPHLRQQHALGLPQPQRIVGDAAYGIEQNYAHLEAAGIDSYLKPLDWHRAHSRSVEHRFHKSHFHYEAASDTFVCPAGERLVFRREKQRRTESGYPLQLREYEGQACGNCHWRAECIRRGPSRWLEVSPQLQRYHQLAHTKLTSELGQALRRRRGVEIESAFGDLKQNQGYRRLRLRGLRKVIAELALLFLGFNLRKLALRTVPTRV